MGILKRAVVPLFLVLMVCAVSVYFYAEDKISVAVSDGVDNRKTVIIDAGHPALKNTKKYYRFLKNRTASPKKMQNYFLIYKEK